MVSLGLTVDSTINNKMRGRTPPLCIRCHQAMTQVKRSDGYESTKVFRGSRYPVEFVWKLSGGEDVTLLELLTKELIRVAGIGAINSGEYDRMLADE